MAQFYVNVNDEPPVLSQENLKERYKELEAISEKLKEEKRILHERETSLKERERMFSISQENLQTVTDLPVQKRVTRLTTVEKKYKSELKEKTRENKRLKDIIETLKMANDAQKKEMPKPCRKRRGDFGRDQTTKKKKVHHQCYSAVPGNVLVCGAGDVGQLGLGEDVMERGRPALVEIPAPVVQVCGGGMHTVCLTDSGDVYSFGCNDDGTLGRDTSEEGSETHPGKVEGLPRIVMVSAGDSHTAALSEEGQVYLWGTFRDNNGSMGMTVDGIQNRPMKVMSDQVVIKIASGGDHLVSLTDDGKIYTCGFAEFGQLGRVAECLSQRGGHKQLVSVLTPGQIRLKQKKVFDDVFVGQFATFAREKKSGEIYACGLNNYYQLGFTDMQNRFVLERVKSFKQMVSVSSGQHHTITLDNEEREIVAEIVSPMDFSETILNIDCVEETVTTIDTTGTSENTAPASTCTSDNETIELMYDDSVMDTTVTTIYTTGTSENVKTNAAPASTCTSDNETIELMDDDSAMDIDIPVFPAKNPVLPSQPQTNLVDHMSTATCTTSLGTTDYDGKPDMYSIQTQTPYNLVKRKHAELQVGPVFTTTETQTDDEPPQSEIGNSSFLSTTTTHTVTSNANNDPDWLPDMSTDSIDTTETPSEHSGRKFVVFESQLDQLFSTCKHCGLVQECSKRCCGSAVTYKTFCNFCHLESQWDSQPRISNMFVGNLILSAAILFAGLSPVKVLTMYGHAGVQMICSRTYNYLQQLYLVPTVMSAWVAKQEEMCDNLSLRDKSLILGGDARCDSPGHTAKFGSYSVMDLETNKILDIQLVQSNEVKNSYWMELEGLKRSLKFLKEAGLTVSHLVTDRHSQIKKFMRNENPSVIHWFDVWHVAKGVYKKLEAAGKKKGCEKVKMWSRSISNHLYWCAASSNGDGEVVQQKWSSRSWRQVHRVCTRSVRRKTLDEERLCLAAMHFNENACRPQAIRKDGESQFAVSYPRGRNGPVAKEVKVQQTYGYVKDLMAEVIVYREHYNTFSRARETRMLEEATWPSADNGTRMRPPPLAHSTPYRGQKDTIIQNRTSRFNH